MNTPIESPRSVRMPSLLIVGMGGTLALWILHIVLREVYVQPPGHPMRLIVTGMLVASFSALIAGQIQLYRSRDEFHRQIQFLALSIAFPLALVANFGVGFFA